MLPNIVIDIIFNYIDMKTFTLDRKHMRALILNAFLYLLFNLQTVTAGSSPDPDPFFPVTDTVCQPAQPHSSYVYSNNGTSVVLSYNGTITFTDDERDIKSISPGGFLKYSKTTFGNKREICIQSGSNGALNRKYFVGRSEEPYEPAGRLWLQETLPEIIATTGIGAEDRVKRIYAKSGVNGVLSEINKMENDRVQGIYFKYLVGLPSIKEKDLMVVLTHINRQLNSDYERSKLLRQVSPQYLRNDKITQEYVVAVNNMSSDYEKGKVLSHILESKILSPASFSRILPAVSYISSDYEQAKVLRQALVNPALPPQAQREVIVVLRTVSSDYEKNRVLQSLIANPKYVNENFEELLGTIKTMSSDYEKARALSTLIAKNKLTPQLYLQVLPVISEINSSYEKSKTLQSMKPALPMENTQVRAAYVKTAKTLSSDYEYRKVIHGLE